jgi:membrane-associated protein
MSAVIDTLIGFVAAYGYPVLFLGIMLENAGIPLPGETALLVAGYLASPEGGGHLHLWAVIGVAFAAAVIGDNLGYLLGRKVVRARLAAGRRFLFLTPSRILRAEGYFDRYGTLTIFFARFVALLRIVGGPAAGASGMPWPRFLLANAAGAAVWATVIGLLGYWSGGAWEMLQRWLGWGSWVVLGVIVLAVACWHFVPTLMRPRSAAGSEGDQGKTGKHETNVGPPTT